MTGIISLGLSFAPQLIHSMTHKISSLDSMPVEVPVCAVSPTSIAIYGSWTRSRARSVLTPERPRICETNQPKSGLSDRARRRLKRSIQWLCELAEPKSIHDVHTHRTWISKVQFITLTLPGKMLHNPKEIKQQCMDPFLTNLRNRGIIKNYVWVMEHHKSGTVHFHLATDSFIKWHVLRRYWNSAIENLGYVSRWSERMRNMHSDEYITQHMQRNRSTFDEAHASYIAGKRSNWRDPNSTDIHSVSRIKNLSSYIAKYMSKASSKTPVEVEQEETGRESEGKIWSRSQELAQVNTLEIELDAELIEELQTLEANHCDKVFQESNFKVLVINIHVVISHSNRLGREVSNWIKQLKESIAVPQEVIKFDSKPHATTHTSPTLRGRQ